MDLSDNVRRSVAGAKRLNDKQELVFIANNFNLELLRFEAFNV